ncbi:hypothetical protein [Marinobacter salicampi]|uniref:hypothetical protein n=1 Tax=Marinobacter salicampi TaxID=435907 RepID=UPI00140CF601|nr:hypothetical protein [Marinobacter salicampi]
MKEYWSIYPKYGNFGVELYLRMTRERKVDYSVLVAKTEIDQASAIALENLRGRSESDAATPERERKIWQSCYQNWDLARAMLLEQMTPCEKHLVALMNNNATWKSPASSVPVFSVVADIVPKPSVHLLWLKNDRCKLGQENQPLNEEIPEVINENCG